MKKTIIHFSGDDFWGSNPHSRYHITYGFHSLGYRIIWINSIGTRFPSIKKRGFTQKIFRKIKSIIKVLRKIENDFYVYTPITLPVFRENGFQLLNRTLLKIQIALISIYLRTKNPILFFSTPMYAQVIDFIQYSKLVYYYSDQYILYRELNEKTKQFLELQDKKLYSSADAIFCASKLIYNNLLSKTKRPVFYLPHSVDYNHFREKRDYIPSDIALINKPIIGYYGTLTDSNDWELIKYCAKKKKNYSFVFIGRKEIADAELETIPNIYFLGKKKYSEIPAYAHHFDVCIMFWIRREWIKNSSPLKLKEYFSVKKPVVSTYIEEIAKYYDEIVYLSDSKEKFLINISSALESNNNERIEKGLRIVERADWISNAKQILEKVMIQ